VLPTFRHNVAEPGLVVTVYNGVSEHWTRGPDARPGVPRNGVESVSSSSEMAVARVGSVNPTRLTCRNEPDGDDLCLDSAFVSDDVCVATTKIDK
jgi:hypothetical protein